MGRPDRCPIWPSQTAASTTIWATIGSTSATTKRKKSGPTAVEVDVEAVGEALNTRIVVNAGAPSQEIRRLYVGMTTLRTMSVLYDNTVRPRVAQIVGRKGLLLDIKDSPPELAGDSQRFTGQKAKRAEQIGKQLRKRGKEFWDDLKEETAGTPTKLSGADGGPLAQLMHHGYLSAMVLLWAEYGESLPRLEELRREQTPGRGARIIPLNSETKSTPGPCPRRNRVRKQGVGDDASRLRMSRG